MTEYTRYEIDVLVIRAGETQTPSSAMSAKHELFVTPQAAFVDEGVRVPND